MRRGFETSVGRTTVREIRGRLELSQERFAQLLGVSAQTVRRWESGLTSPLPIISLRLRELELQTRAQSRRGGGPAMTQEGTSRDEGLRVDLGLGLGGLLKGVGSLLEVVAKLAEEGKEETSRTGTIQAMGGNVRGVYGLSVRLGLGGEPVIERFGNIRETPSGTVVAETREPLVDVLDEGDGILVVAEMPGVGEKDIRVRVAGDVLEITASGDTRRYHKELHLPAPVEAEKVNTSYRNGIFEVRLVKSRAPGV